jgi:hypothetical protein
MTRPYSFFVNPFLTLLERSRTQALQASKYTRNQLFSRKADPFFGPLYTMFDPLNEAFENEDAALIAQIGTQKGSTSLLDELLIQLSSDKIDLWDIAVQVVYRKGTPEYIAIFPKGRKPFQQGKKNDRIAAVSALYLSLAGIVPLATTRTDVDDFYQTINDARNKQTGEIGDTGTDSDDLTTTAETAMNALYKILGSCIAQFPETPLSIEPLFDMSVLRDSEQTEFTRTLAPSATEFIVKRTKEPTDTIRLKVNTNRAVKFFMAIEKNDTNPVTFIIVNGLSEVIVTFSQLGDVPAAKYLKAINTDDASDANVEVELL